MPALDPTPLDLLILTAANAAQARALRAHLRGHRLPARRVLVLPDPRGARIGSGGSTLRALVLVRRLAQGRSRRVLILHSGGEARRLPAYAAMGKILAPSPLPDAPPGRTLLDDIAGDLAPLVPAGHVVVASGDVYLALSAAAPDLAGPGLVGVAIPSDLGRATRHGVYVVGDEGRVTNFLQKPSLATLRRAGAVRRGMALVDSGVLSIAASAAARLVAASRSGVRPLLDRGRLAMDLYRDLPAAVLRQGGFARDHPLRAWADRLAGMPFEVRTAPGASFVHVGTTREAVALYAPRPGLRRINAVTPADLTAPGRAVLDACAARARVRLGSGSMVVNLPRRGVPATRLRAGFGLVLLPVGRRGWACVRFGMDDDFKSPLERSAPGPRSIHASLARLDARGMLPVAGLFAPNEPDRSAWTARLWPVGSPRATLAATAFLQHAGLAPPPAWRRAARLSMKDIVTRVNHERLRALRREAHAEFLLDRLRAEQTPSRRAAMWVAVADAPTPRPRPAAWPTPDRALDMAFRAVAESVAAVPMRTTSPGHDPARDVLVTCPARIDLAGGWTDTPPICSDLGGAVLNAAVTINGEHPIRVLVRAVELPGILIVSTDLRRSTRLLAADSIDRPRDPSRWDALPRAALDLRGLLPKRGRVADHLARRLGLPGLEITLASALPKGSGLGGSSILGAALLAGLARVVGGAVSPEVLIRETSALEQRMTTGGGWQDQAGAITPGVKILTTRPGPMQLPRVDPIDVGATLASPDVAPRLLLYYTGQRRLARNILRTVVLRYLRREPQALSTLARLREGALAMADALRGRDLDTFAARLNEYWTLKQALDPASSNDLIRGILDEARPHLAAASLPGAGGGGYIFMLARSHRAAQRVRHVLTRRPPNPLAGFHNLAIDHDGLKVAIGGQAAHPRLRSSLTTGV